MTDEDPRIAARRRGVFKACAAFGLDRQDRLEVASVLLDRNVSSFTTLTPMEWMFLWYAFNGAVLVARILTERRDGHRQTPTADR